MTQISAPQLKPEKSTKEGKDQESIQSSTTPDQGYQCESNKLTKGHHTQEPRGQPFSSKALEEKRTQKN